MKKNLFYVTIATVFLFACNGASASDSKCATEAEKKVAEAKELCKSPKISENGPAVKAGERAKGTAKPPKRIKTPKGVLAGSDNGPSPENTY